MPNWCYNRLEVIADPEAVAAFNSATTNSDGHLSFDCLVPMPAQMRDGDGWYDWCIEHWGTKWDIRGDELDSSHEVTDAGQARLTFDFHTAWAPPSEWLSRVAPAFPALQFTLWYDEPGACFAGKETFINGRMDYSKSWSGESVGTLNCAVHDCEEWVEGRSVFDFDQAPDAEDLEVFCEDHALVQAVVAAVRADGEQVTLAPRSSQD